MSSADLVSPQNWLEDISIRLASRGDLAALEWEGAYLHFRRVYARAMQRQELGNALLWVVEREPGFLLAQLFVLLRSEIEPDVADGRHRAFMHSFRVRPRFRRRGLGSCLLQHAEMDLIERGFQRLILHVADENISAISFYEHHGYHRVSPVSGEWSYEDHLGVLRHVHEPGWRMAKDFYQY